MSSGIVYLRPIKVARVRVVGPHGEAAKSAWQRIFDWADGKGVRNRFERGFGLVHKKLAPDDNRCAYDACIELVDGAMPGRDEGFDCVYIPGGAYLRDRHRGPIEELGVTLRHLHGEEAVRRGLAVDAHRPSIEIYHNDHEKTGKPHRVDICVPVSV